MQRSDEPAGDRPFSRIALVEFRTPGGPIGACMPMQVPAHGTSAILRRLLMGGILDHQDPRPASRVAALWCLVRSSSSSPEQSDWGVLIAVTASGLLVERYPPAVSVAGGVITRSSTWCPCSRRTIVTEPAVVSPVGVNAKL